MLNVKKSKGHSRSFLKLCLYLLFLLVTMQSCSEKSGDEEIVKDDPEKSENVDKGIYIPLELKDLDFNNTNSTWCYQRSKQSDDFIVFWGAGYGDKDPGSSEVDATYRVDIDDLLLKAESFYDININKLKFAEIGMGASNLDKYKILIFLFYQDEWNATGAGYDDTIGALWLSPNTCQPVGGTIAHEIGHSFQYQVFCDLGGVSGFRYGFGGNGGNAFWEQTAQWQSFQSYPEEAFTSNHFLVYCDNYHRHICHELYRYASYWIHYYWADKHGMDIIGRLWREAQQPEDPLEAYMRMTGISVDQLNEEIYDAATKFVTWDIDAIREMGSNYIGKQTYKYNKLADGSYQVAKERCPGTTGYNVIPLNVPNAGVQVSTLFTGQVNAQGFNQVDDAGRAGWRYGYVALLNNGTRVYGDMHNAINETASFTVPENCKNLWFVVTGAPNTYAAHAWDDDESNDDQWPYKIKLTNTDLLGNYPFDGTETPTDLTLTYDTNFSVDASAYSGTSISVDATQLSKAFVLQSSEIVNKLGTEIKFFGVEANGALNANTTATGYGHWFDASGNVCQWGSDAMVFSELDENLISFKIGQYPAHCKSGDTYTIKQALVYDLGNNESVQVTFVFNITLN